MKCGQSKSCLPKYQYFCLWWDLGGGGRFKKTVRPQHVMNYQITQQQRGFTDHYVADDVILWSEGK